MRGRRRPGIPIALLAFAQLLLPSFAVAHAHGPDTVALDARAAERHTAHAHGAGLPHRHSPRSTDDSRAETGFRPLGTPAATPPGSTTTWISPGGKPPLPPAPSVAGPARGAAAVATLVGPQPRGPDCCLARPLEPTAAGRASASSGTLPVRGPPRRA